MTTANGDLEIARLTNVTLESGATIPNVDIAYRIWGDINADQSNVVLFPSWFTGGGDSLAAFEFIGPGKLADTDGYTVIALDALANGVSTLPDSNVSVSDMVTTHYQVVTEALGISHVNAVMGISLGGTQTIEWMLRYPDFMDHAVPIVGSPRMTPADLIGHRPEIDAINAFADSNVDVALVQRLLAGQHTRNVWHADFLNSADAAAPDEVIKEVAGLSNFDRFTPAHWKAQLEAAMTYDAYRGRGDIPETAALVQTRVLSITAKQDYWNDATPQRELAAAIAGSQSLELEGPCGHLNTACENELLADTVNRFLLD